MVAAVVLFGAGCEAQMQLGPGSSHPQPQHAPAAEQPPPPPAQPGAHHDSAGHAADRGADHGAGHGASNIPGYSPDCTHAHNHCLDPGDVFVSNRPFGTGWTRVEVAVPQGAPGASGEGTYMLRRNGSTLVTGNVWQTRPARPDELAVGMLMIAPERRAGGVHEPPSNRERAHSYWRMGRIMSLAPLDQGQILSYSGRRIDVNAVRLVEGDDSPTTVVSPEQDQHFLSPDHWIISSRDVSGRAWHRVQVGVPIQRPSAETKGNGHFFNTGSGATLWTEHAWQTRPATQADIQLGARVFVPERRKNNVQAAFESHGSAITGYWRTGTVTDTTDLYKGMFTVAGNRTVPVDAARVPVNP